MYPLLKDETLARMSSKHLEKMGRMGTGGDCRNAVEALEALNTQEVDVMFLDIRLPGMSGLNFLRSLSEIPPGGADHRVMRNTP